MAPPLQNTIKNVKNLLSSDKCNILKKKILPNASENKIGASAKKEIHFSAKYDYPQAEPIPLPINIDPTESTRFSPQRARDISSTAIATNIWNTKIDITLDKTNAVYQATSPADPHVESYDCTGAVSLNSSMQSNVPSPFGGMHKFTHLNMPGGQWEQGSKWMSHDLQSSHYTNLRRETRKNWFNSGLPTTRDNNPSKTDRDTKSPTSNNHGKGSTFYGIHRLSHGSSSASMMLVSAALISCNRQTSIILNNTINRNALTNLNLRHNFQISRACSNKATKEPAADKDKENLGEVKNESTKPLSSRETLKRAVKEYGGTVLVFHVTMSLASLGICYQLVASGLDVVAALNYLGLEMAGSSLASSVTAGASTFVIAYAVHKAFAPVRISITLASVPFIVRYLRKRGFLKPKATSDTK